MLDRRALIRALPSVAALPLLAAAVPVSALEQDMPPRHPGIPQLDPELLRAVAAACIDAAAQAQRKRLTRSQLQFAAGTIRKLRDHFEATGFDKAFLQFIRVVDPSGIKSAAPAVISDVYRRFSAKEPSFTESEVHAAFDELVDSDRIYDQVRTLRERGILPSLTAAIDFLEGRAETLPIALWDRPGHPHLETTAMGFCKALTLASGALGTAAFALGFGCLPEPLFLVICPAVVVIGVIAGLVGIVALVAC
jgi:hypothetical protein